MWGMLIFAWFALASVNIISFGLGMMMPGIISEFGVDPAAIGQVVGFASWVQVLSLIPLSILLARRNPRYTVPLIMIGMVAGFTVVGMAQTLTMFYVGYILFAPFSANLVATLLVGAKLRGVPPQQMVQVNGIENFAQPTGQVAALLLIPVLVGAFGTWRSVFATVAIAVAVGLIVYFFIWGDGKRINYGQTETPPPDNAPKTSPFAALKEAASSRVVWLTGLAWPGTTIVWIAMFLYWPTYAITTLGVPLAHAGTVLAMIPLFSAVASLVAPTIAKKVGYDKPFICSWGLLLPIFYFMMTVVTSLPLLFMFSAMAGFGAYFFVPLAFTNVYKIGLSKAAVSISTGIILTFVLVGVAIAGNVVGGLTRAVGVQNALRIACLTPLWFGALTLFLPELGYKKMMALQAASEKGKAS